MIIHLNGWPGVGKQTIGRLVAAQLGARFIHNHLLHDVAIACAGLEGAERWPLYEQVRRAAYATLARLPASEALVMTNALCRDTPREREAWEQVVGLAIARRAALVPVVLEAETEELIRRVQQPERTGKKLNDARLLRAMLTQDTLQRPDASELLVLDTTALSAAESTVRIVRHVATLQEMGALAAASKAHLRIR